MQQTYGDQVTFIGMPGLAGVDSMQVFVEENGVDGIQHVPDATGDLWASFDITQQRTYIFIDDDGSMRVGGYGQLQADVEALIAS